MAAEPFVHTHRVRYHECDAQGIVFNANWFTFFDVTLTEWFRAAFGSYSALMDEHGVDVVLAETTARFKGSARFDDVLEISAEVERLGNSSMVAVFTARRGEATLVEGRTVYVFVGEEDLAKRPIPDAVREALTAYASD